ncbi:MAG: shikimate dehydrogenase [Kofleriaceae bacterium]
MTSARTCVAAILGWPVEHSRSPQIMSAAFAAVGIDGVMIPVGVPPERFAAAVEGLRAIGAIGASVTVPHKLAAKLACTRCTPDAEAIGAVNCLQFSGGEVIGHNTDAQGFSDSLRAAGFEIAGSSVIVLGAGGAARAVVHAVRGAASVEVFARDPSRIPWVAARPWESTALAEGIARASLVVDCTSVGLGGAGERAWVEALPLDRAPPTAWVATLVYHRTPLLLERARHRGHSIIDGKAMLIHQGARAFAIWTGTPGPVAAMARALDDSLRTQ